MVELERWYHTACVVMLDATAAEQTLGSKPIWQALRGQQKHKFKKGRRRKSCGEAL